MRLLVRLGLAVLGTLAIPAVCMLAQPPGGPDGPGPQGFGPMGFGPMTMVMGPNRVQLVGSPEVQSELKIRDDQREKLARLQNELQQAMQERMQTFDPMELTLMPDEERNSRIAEIQSEARKFIDPIEASLKEALDESQWNRLGELLIQREGLVSLRNDSLAEKLSLTSEQKKKLVELAPKLSMRPMRIGGPGGFGPPDFEELQRERTDAENQFLALLTDDQNKKWTELKGAPFNFPQMGPGGPGNRRFGGMGGPERKLVAKYDDNKDGWLNQQERIAAREEAKTGGGTGPGGFGPPGGGPPGGGFGPPGRGRPGGGFGPPGGGFGPPGGGFGPPGGGNREAGKPGVHVDPQDVKQFKDESLYDPSVVRTLFLTFQSSDWEGEMTDFKPTDVEVDATLMVDGKVYENVGVSYRGASSFGMVPATSKRSLNISMDMANKDQRLLGYKSLNLLNSNGDPTLMHSVLYSSIANRYIPTPKTNFVRVVINGEDWGVFQNAQQFDKIFLQESFGSTKGSRWKVPGSPGGGGSLAFLGDDLAEYKRLYEIKSGDNDEAWQALIQLCRVLNETPVDALEAKLPTLLDVEGALQFLALDMALINSDGYWVRGSDYNIYLDEKHVFHIVPHDMNESFSAPMGPGMGGGRGGRMGPGGDRQRGRPNERRPDERRPDEGRQAAAPNNPYSLDPLMGLDDPNRPLRSKLLQVPKWKQMYLQYSGEIAEKDLDWNTLGPIVKNHRHRIEDLVKVDSRKMSSFDAFLASTSSDSNAAERGPNQSLRSFAEQRRSFLLNHPEVKKAMEAK